MHRTLNILDAEQSRYRALNAAPAGPLPHLKIADRRAQRDRRDAFHVPHIDAAVRARCARNELLAEADHVIATSVTGVVVLAGSIGLGAAALFVGSVL